MKLVIIGGTGLIGSKLVTKLREHGHEAVPASPDTGVNTLTGAGLAEVLQGASVVVDVSNSGPDPIQWTVAVSRSPVVLRSSPEETDDACGAGGKRRSWPFSTGSTRRTCARFSNSAGLIWPSVEWRRRWL